jgi:type 1 glutamine amidotransferase
MSNTGELFIDKLEGELLRYASAELPPGLARAKVLRESLIDFVKSGKGIVGVHAATDCSYQWPEYGEMMGGYFNGHPWGPVVLRIDDPENPVNAAFGGKPFAFREEMYTFKPPYSREKLRVLTSIDLAASKIDRGLNRPDDHDYAVSWIKRYGDGRVFYCSFGHGDVSFYDPTIMRHFLAGTQFALGDLEADASPSGALSASRLAENMRVGDAGFQRVASHDAWYRTRKDVKEEVFTGNLTSVTDDNCFYRLDDTPVFTGGGQHPLLDGLVGKRVEILGRLITPAKADDPPKQIWPAQARPAPK